MPTDQDRTPNVILQCCGCDLKQKEWWIWCMYLAFLGNDHQNQRAGFSL